MTPAKLEATIKECKRLIDITSNGTIQEKLKDLIETSTKELLEIQAKEKKESPVVKSSTRSLTKITNYSYEDSNKTLKLYIPIPGAKEASLESFRLNIKSEELAFNATDINGKDYEFILKGLYGKVIPEECTFKQKTDMILIVLKKAKEDKWSTVLKLGDKKKKMDLDTNETNPEEGIMNLMREMYENGDDQMRKTIGEAMMKAREKPGMGMEGLTP
uniref:Calcyclin-binding protein n=1 Tax=Parastrongyloides trichosuri TaxID=131310 RepID=A0A0N4ZK22_PARTI